MLSNSFRQWLRRSFVEIQVNIFFQSCLENTTSLTWMWREEHNFKYRRNVSWFAENPNMETLPEDGRRQMFLWKIWFLNIEEIIVQQIEEMLKESHQIWEIRRNQKQRRKEQCGAFLRRNDNSDIGRSRLSNCHDSVSNIYHLTS